jgi:hypothetical protein
MIFSMTSCAVTKMRDPLFSVHTTDQGKVILYLEEQDAVVDLATDVITYFDISDLENLLIANRANLRDDGAVEALDRARDLMPDAAILIASMTEDEAFNLCQDIITSIKKRKIFNADEMATKVAKLRVIK